MMLQKGCLPLALDFSTAKAYPLVSFPEIQTEHSVWPWRNLAPILRWPWGIHGDGVLSLSIGNLLMMLICSSSNNFIYMHASLAKFWKLLQCVTPALEQSLRGMNGGYCCPCCGNLWLVLTSWPGFWPPLMNSANWKWLQLYLCYVYIFVPLL